MHNIHHLAQTHLKVKTPANHRAFIPYGRQWVDEDDIQSVVEVLRSDYLTQGSKVTEFEQAFAAYVGSRYAVAVNSGTAALHLACLAAELGPGDEVFTSPITFAATANCVLYVGGKPKFIDIDPASFNLDVKTLESYLEKRVCQKNSRQCRFRAELRPRAIIPVHFAGLPCDMPAIQKIAQKYNLIIIEDACHALGAGYTGPKTTNGSKKSVNNDWVKIGSCTHSNMTVFSFHPVKHITSGEGGMVTTNSEKFYQRLVLFRNHGITRDADKFGDGFAVVDSENRPSSFGQQMRPWWYYEMQQLGFNYRITDIQCALGLSQLKKIDYFIQQRRFIADRYSKLLDKIPGICVQIEPEGYKSSYHLNVVCLDAETKVKRDQVMNILKEMGIGTQVHYIPVYRHPFYRQLGYTEEKCSYAESYYKRCFSIPMYPAMSGQEIQRVMNALEKIGEIL